MPLETNFNAQLEECQDVLSQTNLKKICNNNSEELDNCNSALANSHANMANCLSQNVNLRLEIENLNRDKQKSLDECIQNCKEEFGTVDFCLDQCESYKLNCIRKCRVHNDS